MRKILLAAILMAAAPAYAAISLQLAANFDSTFDTEYPTGNKPQGGTCPPSTWTAQSLGDGTGEVCGSATDFDLSVSGTVQPANYQAVYKDAGSVEVQIEGRITDSYTGTAQQFANVGLGIRESSASAAYVFQLHSLQNGSTAIQCQYGENGSYTTANGAASQSRPRYVAVTYNHVTGHIRGHASADGSAWTEVCSDQQTLADVLAYVGGTSRSVSETLTATIDNIALLTEIDAYDESTDGSGASGPTLVTPIPNQTGVQGTAFSLKDSSGVATSCALNFSGATSYSVSGLDVSTGITFSDSLCTFSGTPNSNDVGTTNVTVTATNAGGDLDETFQLTVSAVPGDVFQIPNDATRGTTGNRVYDCSDSSTGAAGAAWSTLGGTGRPVGGDVIEFEAGLHSGSSGSTGPVIRLVNCNGTTAQDLIIRNEVGGTEPAEIRRVTTSNSGFIFNCRSCSNVDITGMGGYSGIEPGELGVADDHTENRVSYGILVTRAAGAGRPAAYFKMDGTSGMRTDASASSVGTPGSGGFTIRGVKVDGVDRADSPSEGSVGICFDLNDHNENEADYASGVFREDIVFTHLYGEFCGVEGGEGFYIGGNAVDQDIPIKNVEVSHSIMENTSSECVNVKDGAPSSSGAGDNIAHHLHLYGCGLGPSNNGASGISLQNPGNWHIYQNYIEDAGEGITIKQSSPASGFDVEILIENNILHEIDQLSTSFGQGIRAIRNSSAYDYSPYTIRNNTFVNVREECVYSQSTVTADIHANIFADCAEGASSASVTAGGTPTNNLTGTGISMNFVNRVLDDFHVDDDSPACGAQTGTAPENDYDGDPKPQGDSEIGADEAAACP